MRSFFCLIMLAACLRGGADNSTEAKRLFADPPREYSSAPFWVWNDLLTKDEVLRTLRDYADQHVQQVILHPRPGLMTPYLSDEWFELVKVAMDEAKRLDMNIWLYDENSYPSGFAGGFVPEAMPQSRVSGLAMREETTPSQLKENDLSVFALRDGGFDEVTTRVRAGEVLPPGKYLTFSMNHGGNSPWFAGKHYVDLMMPGVTQKFLEITLDPYVRHFASELGKRIPGVFTDEPELTGGGGLPWTPDLPEQFLKRRGYSLVENLPALERPVGNWKKVRHDYFLTLLELFMERWAKPYYEYCEKHNLEMTGHYWDHSWPNCVGVPDNMAMSSWQQRPGIDQLFYSYDEGTQGQFGNLRMPKEVASVANQLGRKRTLCESFGGSGWQMRFEDLKRLADWVSVLGINTINEHLSYVTVRGARKRDYPPSFSYHAPYWKAFHVLEDRMARLSVALSRGEEKNGVLVIQPTTSVWMYQAGDENQKRRGEIGSAFQKMVVDLSRSQVEYDIGCEDIMARLGSVEGATLKVGKRDYSIVVITSGTETLNGKTASLLEQYVAAGGKVYCCGEPPALVDAMPSDRVKALASRPTWIAADTTKLPGDLLAQQPFGVRNAKDSEGILLHQRRELSDGQLFFLVNSSGDKACSGTINAKGFGIEEWNPDNGAVTAYSSSSDKTGILSADFTLPPSGSLLLFVRASDKGSVPAVAPQRDVVTLKPTATPTVTRKDENVLVLDYVDVTANGKRREGIHFLEAQGFAYMQNGMDRNPWNHAIQFRDEHISRKFAPESGFELSYRFRMDEKVAGPLHFVVERPDLYAISCNGTTVTATKGAWWLDHSFGRIDITGCAKVGDNTIRLIARPFSVFHEIEAAYVIGKFRVEQTDAGFVIKGDRELSMGSWAKQGCPFYGSKVTYAAEFDAGKMKRGQKATVALDKWTGSVAEVSVNGKSAGFIYAQPYELDVTKLLRSGKNRVEVEVIGTLRNVCGPFYEKTPKVGPPAGKEYDFVDYGLMSPFELRVASGRP